MQTILKLKSWQGAWAVRAVFDDAFRRYLQNQPFDQVLIVKVLKDSAGQTCQRYAQKLHQLTGAAFSFNNETTVTPTDVLYSLSAFAEGYQPLQKANQWRNKLETHYGATGERLYASIVESRQRERRLLKDDSITWLAWSFELLPKFLDFEGYLDRIQYQAHPMAALCWKRWYLADDTETVLWTDVGVSTDTPASKVLVYKFIHEVSHLFHLSVFPAAGNLSDPKWLLTMESVAMATEFLFLEYLQENPTMKMPFEVEIGDIIGTLLVGLYERALRIDFDVQVHVLGMSATEWVSWAVAQTHFPADFFDFAYEFNGVPGFAAGYMLGMECFLTADVIERQELISGKKSICQFINKQIEYEKNY